jgi:hypothetical protein
MIATTHVQFFVGANYEVVFLKKNLLIGEIRV